MSKQLNEIQKEVDIWAQQFEKPYFSSLSMVATILKVLSGKMLRRLGIEHYFIHWLVKMIFRFIFKQIHRYVITMMKQENRRKTPIILNIGLVDNGGANVLRIS